MCLFPYPIFHTSKSLKRLRTTRNGPRTYKWHLSMAVGGNMLVRHQIFQRLIPTTSHVLIPFSQLVLMNLWPVTLIVHRIFRQNYWLHIVNGCKVTMLPDTSFVPPLHNTSRHLFHLSSLLKASHMHKITGNYSNLIMILSHLMTLPIWRCSSVYSEWLIVPSSMSLKSAVSSQLSLNAAVDAPMSHLLITFFVDFLTRNTGMNGDVQKWLVGNCNVMLPSMMLLVPL